MVQGWVQREAVGSRPGTRLSGELTVGGVRWSLGSTPVAC